MPAPNDTTRQALQRNPQDAQLLHDIGYSYLLQDKPTEAIPYLQRALTVVPGFEMANRKLADAYIQTGQKSLAEQTLRKILPVEDVQAELARLESTYDPAMKPSLFGRMRNNIRDLRPDEQGRDDPTRQLLADLERAPDRT